MSDPYGDADDVFDLVAAEQRAQEKNTTAAKPKVVQPTPQALATRASPNAILVSPRQNGNPVLQHIRSVPWEYSDILADYVLGTTTCALFLSLKYHRLHPEYIYRRIRELQGKYLLRLVLCMVDITNHEDPLRELSKTSLVNGVTLMLCWSAEEAGRYLSLYKTYEHAQPGAIKVRQSTNFADQMVDFVTTPRSINKTDAVGLVSNFGSVRTAMNARPEEVSLIAGWGEKKVKRWCGAVREPFRVKRAQRRGLTQREESSLFVPEDNTIVDKDVREEAEERTGVPIPPGTEFRPLVGGDAFGHVPDADKRPVRRPAETMPETDFSTENQNDAMSDALMAAREAQEDALTTKGKKRVADEDLSEGISAALARLRQGG